MLATVVLCDVRDSRKINNRERFGVQLRDCLNDLNQSHSALVAGFAVQAGIDEFAGIVHTANCGEVIISLWSGLYPHAVRCSIVTGLLDVQGVAEQAEHLPSVQDFDGPAFHQAADQLERMRDSDQLLCYQNSALASWQNGLISKLGDLLYAQRLDWTQRQQEVISRYALDGTQTAVADRLGISQSVISRSLAAIDYRRFSRALDQWQACFHQLQEVQP